MFKYILKRILVFIPTLIIISLMAFIISISAPGDPVERLLRASDSEGGSEEQSATSKQAREEIRKKLGLDLPIFYIGFNSYANPDTLYRVADKAHKANLLKLVKHNGNWQAISDYYRALSTTLEAHPKVKVDSIFRNMGTYVTKTQYVDSLGKEVEVKEWKPAFNRKEIVDAKNKSNIEVVNLLQTHESEIIRAKFDSLTKLYNEYPFLEPIEATWDETKAAYETMQENPQRWKTFVPWVSFYGAKNQYHRWVFGTDPWWQGAFRATADDENTVAVEDKKPGFFSIIFYPWVRETREAKGVLRGDFGISYIDGQPISAKIWTPFKWSFLLSLLGISIAYIISIPIGIYAAYKKDSLFDRSSSVILFILYSMPHFFVGTLLLYWFANPDNLVWFPESGIEDPTVFDKNWSFWKKAQHRIPYLILPTLTYTYSSLAFLSRIMRVGIIEIFSQDFIRTARSKGLAERKVVLKHALRNSLLPIITVFANVFPAAIGGAIIIEVIFTYPGMGVTVLSAIFNQDYPIIVAVFTLLGLLTMVGYLISDLLYAVVDPRISYK